MQILSQSYPEGYHFPLRGADCKDPPRHGFYKQIFGATKLCAWSVPGGKVMHGRTQNRRLRHFRLLTSFPVCPAQPPHAPRHKPVSILCIRKVWRPRSSAPPVASGRQSGSCPLMGSNSWGDPLGETH